MTKTISETLYLGLLFAQEDAGGHLTPGSMARWPKHHYRDRSGPSWPEFLRGFVPCGCIHGAAVSFVGEEPNTSGFDIGPIATAYRNELVKAGITVTVFDKLAEMFEAYDQPTTVDAVLEYLGVDVVPDAELTR